MVAVPTLSRPTQHKSQTPANATHDAAAANSGDGVDVHSFLEAVLQIIHTSNDAFRYNLCARLIVHFHNQPLCDGCVMWCSF